MLTEASESAAASADLGFLPVSPSHSAPMFVGRLLIGFQFWFVCLTGTLICCYNVLCAHQVWC